MLWKPSNLKDTAAKGVKKLLVPFALYSLAGQVVKTVCLLTEGVTDLKPYLYSPLRSLVLGGTLSGNPPLWFIPSMFVVQCTAAWLTNKRSIPWLWAFVSVSLGYLLFLLDPEFVPTYIESAFGGLFFFFMGNWLKEWQYKKWVTVVCLICTIAVLAFGLNGLIVRTNNVEDDCYFVGVLASLVGCVAINGLFRWLQPYLKLRVLQYVGRNAMTIYVTHWIVLSLSVGLLGYDLLHVSDSVRLLLIGGISYLVVIPIYIQILKHFKSRKGFV